MHYILEICHLNTGDNLFAESYCSGAWSDGEPMEQHSMGFGGEILCGQPAPAFPPSLMESFSQLFIFCAEYFTFPRQKFYCNSI